MKKGDLIKHKRSGRFAVVVRETYTKKFMDSQDYEMVSHGMGHMAGSYGSAIDIQWMEDGRKQSIKLTYPSNFEKVSKSP